MTKLFGFAALDHAARVGANVRVGARDGASLPPAEVTALINGSGDTVEGARILASVWLDLTPPQIVGLRPVAPHWMVRQVGPDADLIHVGAILAHELENQIDRVIRRIVAAIPTRDAGGYSRLGDQYANLCGVRAIGMCDLELAIIAVGDAIVNHPLHVAGRVLS